MPPLRVVREWQTLGQRSYGCPIPGSVEGQVGHRGLEQAAVPGGVPGCGRGWSWMSFKVPSGQAIPCPWDSVRGGCCMRKGPAPQAGLTAPPLPRAAGPCVKAGSRTTAPGVPRAGEPRADWLRRRARPGREAELHPVAAAAAERLWCECEGPRSGLEGVRELSERGWDTADPLGSGSWGRALPRCWRVAECGG